MPYLRLAIAAALLLAGGAFAQERAPVSTSLFQALAPAGWQPQSRPSIVNLASPADPLESTGVLLCDPRAGTLHEACVKTCAASSLRVPHVLEPLDLAAVRYSERRRQGFWEYRATGPFKQGRAWLTVSILCDGEGLAVVGTRAASRQRSAQLQDAFVSSVQWRP